uniref:Secreted protein n=1 Tax=Macrostomum lignano TaxID=282301 RepID=A0A1I8JF32_9PLAT
MFGKLLMMATALSVIFIAAQAAVLVCSAVSFVRESGLCLLSAVRNASFGAAGGGSQVFRRTAGGLEP